MVVLLALEYNNDDEVNKRRSEMPEEEKQQDKDGDTHERFVVVGP